MCQCDGHCYCCWEVITVRTVLTLMFVVGPCAIALGFLYAWVVR